MQDFSEYIVERGTMRIGAWYPGKQKCEFTVWAPNLNRVEVKIVSSPERIIPMEKDAKGYWKTVAIGVTPGTPPFFRPLTTPLEN